MGQTEQEEKHASKMDKMDSQMDDTLERVGKRLKDGSVKRNIMKIYDEVVPNTNDQNVPVKVHEEVGDKLTNMNGTSEMMLPHEKNEVIKGEKNVSSTKFISMIFLDN